MIQKPTPFTLKLFSQDASRTIRHRASGCAVQLTHRSRNCQSRFLKKVFGSALHLIFVLICISTSSQVLIDQPIQLTGSGSSARLTGIKQIGSSEDATSAEAIQKSSVTYAVSTNTGNDFSVVLTPAPAAYTAGLLLHFYASANITGPASLNVNGLGAIPIMKNFDTTLITDDIKSGQIVSVIFDGTNFQMLSPTGNATGGNSQSKRAFVTSTTYSGNLGGISGADALCQARADAASLGGSWIAWLSTSAINAISRSVYAGQIVSINGDLISNNGWNGLTGNIILPIQFTELGTLITNSDPVTRAWTGTKYDGTFNSGFTCSDWTSTSGSGTGGAATVSGEWSQNSNFSCATLYRLYCFEQ